VDVTRRDFLTLIAVAGGLGALTPRALAQQLEPERLLDFQDLGNVTLLHMTDAHATLNPVYYREPDTLIGEVPGSRGGWLKFQPDKNIVVAVENRLQETERFGKVPGLDFFPSCPQPNLDRSLANQIVVPVVPTGILRSAIGRLSSRWG
jgi:hypothetical protein